MSTNILRKFISEALKNEVQTQLPNGIVFIHISHTDQGEKFRFTPQVPDSPSWGRDQKPNEDPTTPRISWAKTIKQALNALSDAGSPKYWTRNRTIYGVESLPGFVDCKHEFLTRGPQLSYVLKAEIGTLENTIEYGEKYWAFSEYAKFANLNPKDYSPLIKLVPDALKSEECWSTQPVLAKRIGTILMKSGKIEWVV